MNYDVENKITLVYWTNSNFEVLIIYRIQV